MKLYPVIILPYQDRMLKNTHLRRRVFFISVFSCIRTEYEYIPEILQYCISKIVITAPESPFFRFFFSINVHAQAKNVKISNRESTGFEFLYLATKTDEFCIPYQHVNIVTQIVLCISRY